VRSISPDDRGTGHQASPVLAARRARGRPPLPLIVLLLVVALVAGLVAQPAAARLVDGDGEQVPVDPELAAAREQVSRAEADVAAAEATTAASPAADPDPAAAAGQPPADPPPADPTGVEAARAA